MLREMKKAREAYEVLIYRPNYEIHFEDNVLKFATITRDPIIKQCGYLGLP
jgi:hypothetical protein